MQVALLKFAVDPFQLLRRNQQSVAVEFSFIKLSDVLVSIAEYFVSEDVQFGVTIVPSLD